MFSQTLFHRTIYIRPVFFLNNISLQLYEGNFNLQLKGNSLQCFAAH